MYCDVFCEDRRDEYGRLFHCYGLCLRWPEGGTLRIDDVTTEWRQILELCRRLRSCTVERCHIYDVVEDFLAEISTV